MGHLKISWAHLDTLVANWVGGLALFPKLFWQLSRALHPDKNPDLDKVSCRELRVTVSNFEGLTMFGIKDQGELSQSPRGSSSLSSTLRGEAFWSKWNFGVVASHKHQEMHRNAILVQKLSL